MKRKVLVAGALSVLLTGCSSSSSDDTAPQPTNSIVLQLSVLGATAGTDVRVEVADGFDAQDTWYVVSSDQHEFLGVYTTGFVYRDACRPLDRAPVTPGPSVEDLVEAMQAQHAIRVSEPEPVTIAGYQGLYVEVTGPRDLSRCTQPGLWDGRNVYSDEQVDLLWILDVDGQRVVVDASYGPMSSAGDIDNLMAMIESLQFDAA